MCRPTLLALLAVILTIAADAQTKAAPKLALRALALRPLVEKELWLKDGDAFVPLAVSNIQPTAAQRADLTSPLLIFRGPRDPQGKPASLQPVSVPLPAHAASVLLLAWPTADVTRFTAIPDDFTNAGPASWLLVNTTRHPLAFQLGADSQAVTIQPAQHLVHRVTSALGEGAAVKVAMPDDGNWKVIYSTYWPLDPTKRSLVLFVDDARKIRVKLILDDCRQP